MENNELLRMISQVLQQNQEINNVILELLLEKSGLHSPRIDELKRLLAINASTLKFLSESIPTE